MSEFFSRFHESKLANTMIVSIVASGVIVATAAGLGRAVRNLQGAVTDKPDLAVYLLLPDEGITDVKLLRSSETQRDYITETKEGTKLVKLELRDEQWAVADVQPMRE